MLSSLDYRDIVFSSLEFGLVSLSSLSPSVGLGAFSIYSFRSLVLPVPLVRPLSSGWSLSKPSSLHISFTLVVPPRSLERCFSASVGPKSSPGGVSTVIASGKPAPTILTTYFPLIVYLDLMMIGCFSMRSAWFD
jgi:hypothetical protein